MRRPAAPFYLLMPRPPLYCNPSFSKQRIIFAADNFFFSFSVYFATFLKSAKSYMKKHYCYVECYVTKDYLNWHFFVWNLYRISTNFYRRIFPTLLWNNFSNQSAVYTKISCCSCYRNQIVEHSLAYFFVFGFYFDSFLTRVHKTKTWFLRPKSGKLFHLYGKWCPFFWNFNISFGIVSPCI